MPQVKGCRAWNRLDIDDARLIREYAESSAAVKRLAREWGVHITVLYRRLRERGVAVRSNSTAHKGLQVGEANPFWKGGRAVGHDGYVHVRVDNAQMREHRKVARDVLGRELQQGEVVHHRNHDRTDNRPENLEVMTASAHARLHAVERAEKRRAALAALEATKNQR